MCDEECFRVLACRLKEVLGKVKLLFGVYVCAGGEERKKGGTEGGREGRKKTP